MRETAWREFHLFYHGDRDHLLHSLVRPLVTLLWQDGRLESFFFVRFALGGPHLRLRFLPRDGAEDITREIEEATARYLAAEPSREVLSEEDIRRENATILSTDPGEDEDVVYPDNSLITRPFHIEEGRYGGPDLVPASLDFFAFSSAQAFVFIAETLDLPPGRRLPGIGLMLMRQAWGLARDGAEFLRLLEYAIAYFGASLRGIIEHADKTFDNRREVYLQLVDNELRRLSEIDNDGEPSPLFGVGAGRHLRALVDPAPPAIRKRVLQSQLHMSANRLGLRNPDEVYLCRLFVRALREWAAIEPARWADATATLATAAAAAAPRVAGEVVYLDELVPE